MLDLLTTVLYRRLHMVLLHDRAEATYAKNHQGANSTSYLKILPADIDKQHVFLSQGTLRFSPAELIPPTPTGAR